MVSTQGDSRRTRASLLVPLLDLGKVRRRALRDKKAKGTPLLRPKLNEAECLKLIPTVLEGEL